MLREQDNPKKDEITKPDSKDLKKDLLGIVLAAIAAVICVAIDQITKEE